MTRKKVKLVWIVNDAARKASLKKRRIGLLKKVSELTTLCGVSAFAIIYSPDEAEPMVWPSRPVVQQMLMRYQNIPEMERCKKMMNQETYLKERMSKIHEHSRKNQKKNRDIEMSFLMDKLHYQGNGIDDFEISDMQILAWLLEERMKDIRKRVDYFQQIPPLLPPGLFPDPPSPQQGQNMEEMAQPRGDDSGGDHIRNNNPADATWDQWFLDMVNNNESTTAGSSATKNDMSSLPPHAYNFPVGFAGGEVDMGPLGLGLPLPYSHGNFTMGSSSGSRGNAAIDMGLPPPPVGGNPFGLGPSHESIAAGSNTAGNSMELVLPAIELGLPPPSSTGGGSNGNDVGLPGFFAGGSDDMGPPYDVTKGWPYNFSQ